MLLQFETHGNEKQKECARAWADPALSDIFYGGAKGGAKSFTGCKLIFSDALTYPGTHYFIARKKLNDIRKFTIPSIYECFETWKININDYAAFNGMDNFYRLYNDSRVYLLEAKYLPKDPLYSRFGSMQMTRGWIEEAGEFEKPAKSNLQASIGRWKNDVYGLPAKLLQTGNPAKNYLYYDYYLKHKTGDLENWKTFIQSLPTDNKKLPAGYIEQLERSLTENERQRLLLGNWEYDDDPAALMNYNKIVDLFSNTHVPGGRKCITVDPARLGGDHIPVIEWDGFRGHIRYSKKQLLTATLEKVEQARTRIGCGKSDVVSDDDGLGGGLVDFGGYKGFVNNGSPLPSPDKPQFDQRGNIMKENYDNLKSQCYYRMAERINNNGYYLTYEDDRVKQWVIEEMEQVKQKKLDSDMKKGVVPKDKIKELIGRSPDFADCVMMREYLELMPQFKIAVG